MRSKVRPRSTQVNLKKHLGPEGETEYQQLVAMLQMTLGRFALMPARSDFPTPVRDALIKRLKKDLRPTPVVIVPLGWTSSWDAMRLISEAAAKLPREGVVILTGLEMTPGVIPAPGEEDERPPALAVLNHGREALKIHCPHPLILWTDGPTFRALAEHAPDFLDHFTGLFRFDDASPSKLPNDNGMSLPQQYMPLHEIHRGLRSRIAFYESQLKTYATPSLERANALRGLATAHVSHTVPDAINRLHAAEAAAREALDILEPLGKREEWASTQVVLGMVLAEKVSGNCNVHLREAIACYHAALSIYTESDYPSQWAMTLNNLGNAHLRVTGIERDESLREAITCYRSLLRVRAKASDPVLWAGTQMNLGIAYENLTGGDRDTNLKEASACYNAALGVYSEFHLRAEHALALNNLGLSLVNSISGDRDSQLREAIACLRTALRINQELDDATGTAMSLHNLGLALSRLATGDQEANIRESIACYRRALDLFIEMNSIHPAALTRFNLAVNESRLGEFDSSARNLAKTFEAFKMLNDEEGMARVKFMAGVLRSLSDPPQADPEASFEVFS